MDNYPPTKLQAARFMLFEERADFWPKPAFSQLRTIFVPQLRVRGAGSRSEMTERPSSTSLQLNYSGWSPPPAVGGRGPAACLGRVWKWSGCLDCHNIIAPASKRSFYFHVRYYMLFINIHYLQSSPGVGNYFA